MEMRQQILPTTLKRKNPTTTTTTTPSSSSSLVYGNVVPNNVKRPKDEFGYSSNNVVDNLGGQFLDNRNVVDNVAPIGFLDPLPPLERELLERELFNARHNNNNNNNNGGVKKTELQSSRKQFWKAGDYEGPQGVAANASSSSYSGGLDHVRVHPRFLHSNATSHKWVLGAFAELLDNALDEVCNGATYVSVDMVYNEKLRQTMLLADKDRYRMLQIQDNGGGMNPEKMRQCISLGYSAKSKIANVIGQYGNGFKTSTMRLGADVIVFSVCPEKDNACATRSIGMLSYTFLTSTGKQDIVVPMVDYEKKGNTWTKMLRGSMYDWHTNLETIAQWSPFSSEQELLQQFNSLGYQGTKVVIYNLWEDDQGQLELDFDTDPDDIQIRGVNRDKDKIAMSEEYPNSKHYLTYQHSLRSYASILYLRLPPGFRIVLRGIDVVHHNLVNDMMHPKQVAYKPVPITYGTVKGSVAMHESIQALVTLGFVKDAHHHIDIQGFNVYHKNRLIKPFWRVWNAAGSDGRGVIGVLEANFVEPAHDKQGFEKTTALSRLEARLNALQKIHTHETVMIIRRDNCHEIGYAPRRPANKVSKAVSSPNKANNALLSITEAPTNSNDGSTGEMPETSPRTSKKAVRNLPVFESSSDEEMPNLFESPPSKTPSNRPSSSKAEQINGNLYESPEVKTEVLYLRKEVSELKNTLREATEARDQALQELKFEKDRSKSFEVQLEAARKKIADKDTDQQAYVASFAEETERRDVEKANMRRRLDEASSTIELLVARVTYLESRPICTRCNLCKPEQQRIA